MVKKTAAVQWRGMMVQIIHNFTNYYLRFCTHLIPNHVTNLFAILEA